MRVTLTPRRIVALVGAGAILLGGGSLLAWRNHGSSTAVQASQSGTTSVSQEQPGASSGLPAGLESCRALPKSGPVGLPAVVAMYTEVRRRCGALRLLPNGRVERIEWRSLDSPLPEGSVVSFAAAPRLVVAQRDGRMLFLTDSGQELWRSSGRYKLLRTPCQLAGLAVGAHHAAFARRGFGANPSCDRLYIASRPGPEVPVPGVVGETPLAWIGGERLVTWKYLGQAAGFRITLRDGNGKLLRVLSNASAWQVIDPYHDEAIYTTRSQILRIGRGGPQVLADRAAIRLAGPGGLYISSLPDRRVAVFGPKSLAVLEADGTVFATAKTGRSVDTLEMRQDGRAAAYLNVDVHFSAHAASRTVAIMLLLRGANRGKELHTYKVGQTTKGWHTSLKWSGDWLLASSGDGHTVAIDSRSGRVEDLTSLARTLAHPSGQEVWGLAAAW